MIGRDMSPPDTLPMKVICDQTWQSLMQANEDAKEKWEARGIFAAGIGPSFKPGSRGSLLYVGKSAGPLHDRVRSCLDQEASARASAQWMINRCNKKSAFWHFADQITREREKIAWTNICKMDSGSGDRPPRKAMWDQIAKPCIAALKEEIRALRPHVTVFVTSGYCQDDVMKLVERLGYQPFPLTFSERHTTAFSSAGRYVIMTRHPQGWSKTGRDQVVELVKTLLSAEAVG
jgi:hypothetical protein